MEVFDAEQWRAFESAQWHGAVRYRGLELRSLDADERVLVFDAIASDLERRKKALTIDERPAAARRIL